MTDRWGQSGSTFGPGAWEGEPGRIEWHHAGFPCLMRRSIRGNWCGYVAVPPGHPAHGKGYEDVEVAVHGGLTYADKCDGAEGEGICHVPHPREQADVWWLGFDCAHSADYVPDRPEIQQIATLAGYPVAYRDENYVRAEVESLAEQLAVLR